uniref:ABC transporter domain-containing protein n=1 Tax=Physcomitrium patens TaxID=3218 RepID=A0A7I4CW03_PHYPA
MADLESSDSTPKGTGDVDSRVSRPSLDSVSAVDVKQTRTSANLGRAPSNGERGQSTVYDNSGPTIRRQKSHSSARIQPLASTRMTDYQGIDIGGVSFDPRDLLEEGLGEWQDRARSLLTLKRSSSIASARASYRGLGQTPSLRFERQQSARPSHDSYGETEESTQGAVRYSTGDERDGDRFQFSEPSDDGTYGGHERLGLATPGFETPPGSNFLGAGLQHESRASDGEGNSQNLSRDFYANLADAPQASLIHLVSLYHQTLVRHGLVEEALSISSVLAGLQNQEESTERELELKGIDLLLKEGLLKYLLSIHPHLPPLPRQVVKFQGLTYSEKVKIEKGYETMFTKIKSLLGGPFTRLPVENMTLLKDVTGYLMPGTLTLVVGSGKRTFLNIIGGRSTNPGGSLKGTVTYNGIDVHNTQCRRLAAVVPSVDVHLPSLTVRETLEFARDCTASFKTKHYSEELKVIMGEALKHGQDPKLEMNLSILSLKRVADRPVGSPMMPSLTASEQHHLTTAEMIAGIYPVYVFDQLNAGGVSEGMTFDLVSSVRIFTRVRQCSVLASTLQPSQEIFDLFDRIILLDGGQVMFQGPRQDALPYFESLGYLKPKHLSTSEFLSDVTTPEGVRYLQPGFTRLNREDFVASFLLSPTFRDIRRVVHSGDSVQEHWVQGHKPLGLGFTERRSNNTSGSTTAISTLVAGVIEKGGSLAEITMDHTSSVAPGDEVVAVGGAGGLLKYFKSNDRRANSSLEGGLAEAIDEVAEPVRLQLERPLDLAKEAKNCPYQFQNEYLLNFVPEVNLLLKREMKVLMRNRIGLRLRVGQVLIMSIYTGVVFFRVQDDPNQLVMNLKRSVFFISLLNITLINLGQLPALMEERAIYYKQQGARFFRPQSFLFSKILGALPISMLEATLWTLVVYFMTDLSVKDGGWHFWVYYVILSLTAINGASLVRFMAYFAPDRDAANAIIGILVALFIVFAGFLVPRFLVPKYWLWAYYIDPLQWATLALVLNEYNSKSYSLLCNEVPNLANIPQCIGRPTDTVGHAYLARGQFYTSNSWIAVAVAVLLGWIVLWNIGAYFAMAKKRHLSQALSPYMEKRLSWREQHQVKTRDEEWGQGESKLCLESIPITLSWHELSYEIMIPAIGRTQTVLNYVSGWGKPGEMVALAGGSGAGKTTLLNCLAGRKISPARLGGQILVNGYTRVRKTFAHVEGYVEDIMAYAPYMTVREGIEFSAAMRLSKKVQAKERKLLTDEVMKLMKIDHISNMILTLAGNEEVSKEQAVRLAIAIELAGNPSVLFLDGPTSGLDSHASRHIIECLKTIADTGRLVIVSIQLLNPWQLSVFNSIQLLKRGGETVYFGSPGANGESLLKYFEAIPGTPRCSLNKSPITYAIDVIGDRAADHKTPRDYAFEYRVSELALRNHIQLQILRRSKGDNGPELLESGYRAPYLVMAWEIMLKIQRMYWRNTSYNFGRMTGALALALILGTIYFNINPHTTVNMNVKSQSLFILCILLGISNAQNVIPQILRMTVTVEREQLTNQFNVLMYNAGWTLGEVPYLAVSTMIVCFVFCLMAQIAVDSAAHFFRFYFVLFEFCLAITFLGIFICVISPIPQVAATLVPIVIGFWTATAGSVVPKMMILKTVIWIFWTNPLQWALNALTSIAFFCDTNKPACLDSGRNLACLNDPTACPQCDCKRLDDARNAFLWTTLKVNRTLDHSRVPIDMLVLFLYCVFFRVATALAISYFQRKRLQMANKAHH